MHWLRALLRRDEVERELDEELRFHLDMQTEENIRRGMDPAEARRQARVAFGGVEGHKEASRDTRALRWLHDAARDARFGWRSLRRSPGFATAAVLTIALGIGANTAIFGVADALFLRTPPGVRDADSVVRLYIARDEGNIQAPGGGPGSYVDFRAIRARATGMADVAAFFGPREVDLDRGERARRVQASVVTGNFFSLLGVSPQRGRFFLAGEDSTAGAHPVAVVSHRFWRSHLGGDAAVLGRTLLLNNRHLTVIGVAEAGFEGIGTEPVDVWVTTAMAAPLGLMGGSADWREQPFMLMVDFVARLAPGSTREAVAASAGVALARAASASPGLDPTPHVLTGTLAPAGRPESMPAARLALWLLVVTGLVLVVACANVANLLLSRGAARRRETAIRRSVGAGRGRLVRQHLAESLVLSALGGALGVLLAMWGAGVASRFPLPPAAGHVNTRSLLFALALTAATALLFGLAPALQALRSDTAGGLRDAAGGAGPAGRRVRSALVGVQVALAVILLAGAGLFVRSLRAATAVDPGVDVDRILLVSVDLKKAGYGAPDREAFLERARERLRALPGVEAVGVAHFPPLPRSGYVPQLEVRGVDTLRIDDGPYINLAAPGYFRTVGTRVLHGRDFVPADRTGEPAAVVNEAFARVIDPDGNALGACLHVQEQVRDGGCTRVVGVVENQRRYFLDEKVPPSYFLLRDRDPDAVAWGAPSLVVRTRGEPGAQAGAVRAALQSLDPRLPFVSAEPLASVIGPELLPFRLGASLFTLFGALALALAAVGLYGCLGYFVAERRPEIGIRRSLGAGEGHVVRLVLREGFVPVAVGVAAGLAVALAGARLLESLLFGIGARDPVSFTVAALFAAGVALSASWLPARRAAGVDPMVALRAE
jgi:predicted permease